MEILLQGERGTYAFDPENPEGKLGQGGMGVVFKGMETTTKQVVAIKVLYKEIAPNFQAVERERQSAGIRIHHKNLIQMLDFIEQGGIFHIVSEFVEGKTLHDHLQELKQKNQRLGTAEALSVINQTLNGLEALHKNNPPVIHRDIDPSNVMICSDGTVKIMDFGIAKISDGKRKSLTGIGTVIGKPHYSPPEQIRGETNKINQSTDIYALGITFYEMFTGSTPFDASNEYDVMKMQMEKPLPGNPQIPAEIFRLIQKATEKQQARRYQTVNDFRYALNSIDTKNTAVVTEDKQVKTWRTRAVSLGIFSFALLTLLLWSFSRKGGSAAYNQLHPVEISKIEFRNTNNNGSIRDDFGKDLYAENIRYIQPKIYFKSNVEDGTIPLFIKYYDTNLKLLTNSTYMEEPFLKDFSLVVTLDAGVNGSDGAIIRGYGRGDKSIFQQGTYTCEIWYYGQMLAKETFKVKGSAGSTKNNWLDKIFGK